MGQRASLPQRFSTAHTGSLHCSRLGGLKSLPDELLIVIFSRCSCQDLVAAEQVRLGCALAFLLSVNTSLFELFYIASVHQVENVAQLPPGASTSA